MKGFLIWHGQTFRKTHSLEETGERCLAIDASLRAAIDRAVPLSEYAWKFRYPGNPQDSTAEEAAEALAREAFEAILIAVSRRKSDPRLLEWQ